MEDHYVIERYYGGGTHRVVSVVERSAAVESARFLARQEDALQRAEAAATVDELSAVIHDYLNA